MPVPTPSPHARHWDLDPEVVFLNHGSFGACPRVVLEQQQELRAQMEREPVLFLWREFEDRLDGARAALAKFVGSDPKDLVFVPNATYAINAVLRSLAFEPGDELLVTDHEYNAARNAIDFVAERSGATVVTAPVPFPIADAEVIVEAVLRRVTARTRLFLVDHVTSPTGLVQPIAKLVGALRERGIDTLVDGAHAPGMLPLDLDALGAAYYTGNCHKWLCAPKGAALLHVRRDRQDAVRPLAISHGMNSRRTDRSRLLLEFDWCGTDDPTAFLCVPTAIDFLRSLFPDGFDGLRRHNRELALAGRDLLCAALGCDAPAPATMIGSLASVILPPVTGASVGAAEPDPWHVRLFAEHRIEVPIQTWPSPALRLLRISPQAYNSLAQYEMLATAVGAMAD